MYAMSKGYDNLLIMLETMLSGQEEAVNEEINKEDEVVEEKLEIVEKRLNKNYLIKELEIDYGVNASTIIRWVKNYQKYGIDGLKCKYKNSRGM